MKIAEATKVPSVAKFSRYWPSKLKAFEKAVKSRSERRRAKRNPECVPAYGRYRGCW